MPVPIREEGVYRRLYHLRATSAASAVGRAPLREATTRKMGSSMEDPTGSSFDRKPP